MITSIQNQKIKDILKLGKSKERKKKKLALVEGKRELEICLKGGYKVEELIYCKEFGEKINDIIDLYPFTEVSEKVFRKISHRENPDGILVIIKTKKISLQKYRLKSNNPLVLVLDGIEKPGNLGAILRTSDGAGVDLVILNNSNIDIYNPNAIRASQGTVFSQAIVEDSVENTYKWLKLNKISTFSATPHTKNIYYNEGFKNASAILLGSEDKGLSKYWLKNSDKLIKLSMLGKIDSLNVSVAGAILLYEVVRQRKV